MSHIRLSFGSPRHGWLPVELADVQRSVSLVVSDVPGDSLTMLAMAALDLASGRKEARVTWFLEPDKAAWVFRRVGGHVEVHAAGEGATTALIQGGPAEEVALVIWRALRRLQSDPAWTNASVERVWAHSFPSREVTQLGVALGRKSEPQPS